MRNFPPFDASSKKSLSDSKARELSHPKDQSLPWQVQSALNRLRRDLKALPMFKEASLEDVRRTKLKVVDDVIRPIRTPELLKDFLLHCDVVARDIVILEEAQIEREILSALSKEMLVATSRAIVRDMEQIRGAQDQMPNAASAKCSARGPFLLREIARRLRDLGSGAEAGSLESFLNRQGERMDKSGRVGGGVEAHHASQDSGLAGESSDAAESERLVVNFLINQRRYIESLAEAAHDGASKELIVYVCRILPELLRRKEYRAVVKILEAGKARDGKFNSEGELTKILLRSFVNPEALKEMLADLNCQDKERRDDLVEILTFVGEPAGPGLVEAYSNSKARAVRMSIFEVLRRLEPETMQAFMARLPQMESDGLMIFRILEVAGELGDRSFVQTVASYVSHSSSHVRRAALTALYKLQGSQAESHFVQALRDPEAELRQLAVEYLRRIKSGSREALTLYLKALREADPSAPSEQDAVLIEICRTLASAETLPQDYVNQVEHILLQELRPPEPKGLLDKWLKEPPPQLGERLRIAMCKTLAAIGSPAAIAALSRIAESEKGALAEIASAAARQIQERSSRGPQQNPS